MKYLITTQVSGSFGNVREDKIEADSIAIKDGIVCFYNKGQGYHYCYKPAQDQIMIIKIV